MQSSRFNNENECSKMVDPVVRSQFGLGQMINYHVNESAYWMTHFQSDFSLKAMNLVLIGMAILEVCSFV